MSDGEYRKVSKETTEVSKTGSETSETRSTSAGRYEKTTTTSELHEKRINESEVFEPSPGMSDTPSTTAPPVRPASLAPTVKSNLGAAPWRIKLSLAGVMSTGAEGGGASLDGDYILTVAYREQDFTRWEYRLPAAHRFHCVSVVATLGPTGAIELEARFEGAKGPKWRATVNDINRSFTLHWDMSIGNPIAGNQWPEQVRVVPLDGTVKAPFYISPTVTVAEWDDFSMLDADSGSGSSSPNCSDCSITQNSPDVGQDIIIGQQVSLTISSRRQPSPVSPGRYLVQSPRTIGPALSSPA